ncbi:MaoC family dehydratase [Microvirga pudoricolor]|uniref:MaoC family dehydratase n=1 Tax=Microvirga pudoricolor TaxID=2778729 RepID=UPI001950C15E|nr:MaoC family dehydratase [Microvirga pudoricolor]MBM6592785.1 MaoC family dehydratase [Microvirga pudoricolor]
MTTTFEDLRPGTTFTFGPIAVSKEEIVAFAREYDPQPFHVDEVAARDSFIGTLIASGWHTASLNMRLFAEGILLDSTGMGAPGVEELKWLKPVKPGDSLRSRVTVTDSRPSGSRPTLGLVQFAFEVLNQQDEPVMTQSNWVLFGRREPGPDAPAKPAAPKPAGADHSGTGLVRATSNPYLDDLVAGETTVLGSYTFTAEEIVRFARAFDPQRFHVDPVAAQESLLGGLCASGWHTACIWMQHLAAHRDETRTQALARGQRPARLGPSPGFTNMRWLKPVYAGDTITYRTTLTNKRASASRPGWGLAFHHNTAVNQKGEEVFAFDGMVFWERRPER